MTDIPLHYLNREGHAAHTKRCLTGLPASQTDIDSSRLALIFYCIGSLDILDLLKSKTSEVDRQTWAQWIWEQYTKGQYGSGFKPSPYMTPQVVLGRPRNVESDFNTPHMIMTYTGVLGLAILRDDFSKLDRGDLIEFIRACQAPDGSFASVPRNGETDLRALYCAFALSCMLDDWSGINIERAVTYITSCRTYEGGYGQSPNCEAQGGTTYLAVASLYLIPGNDEQLTKEERRSTIQWLLRNQEKSGGFCGRTGKDADACYCFWCGAALKILGASAFLDKQQLATFLDQCQFKYGGISKAPGEHPDPYHTYLSLAAVSIYPPDVDDEKIAASWRLSPLDPYINATVETAEWAKQHVPSKRLGNENSANTS